MIGLEIDGYISKRGKGKSASYFVRKKFIDRSSIEKNENSNNGISMQQNVRFSSPQTIEKARKDIEKENIELEDIQKNTPLLNRYDTPQPRNHERKTENAHLNKSAYCLDNFLQEEISFLKKELDNKKKVIDNLINLLNGVTTKRDETNFSCKNLQIKNTNETISSNRFSIAQNKSQLNVAKEQLTAAPSDTSTNSDNINNQYKKKAIFHLKRNNKSKDKLIRPS